MQVTCKRDRTQDTSQEIQTVPAERLHEPPSEFACHQSRQIGSRTGQPRGMADPRRSRRLLPPHRDVRHDRDDRQPHLLPRAGIARPVPDQSLRDAVRGNRCLVPDQGRSRRQHPVQRVGLWRQRRRLRHSQRHSHGAARHGLRRRIPTRRPAWRSRRWNAACCRWRRPRCGFSTSPITTSKASPTTSTSASGWWPTSAITKR